LSGTDLHSWCSTRHSSAYVGVVRHGDGSRVDEDLSAPHAEEAADRDDVADGPALTDHKVLDLADLLVGRVAIIEIIELVAMIASCGIWVTPRSRVLCGILGSTSTMPF